MNPGALFGVIWIKGEGVETIEIVDKYYFQFDVVNGKEGKVRAYVYNVRDECIEYEIKLTEGVHYTVDNVNNVVTVSFKLSSPLGADQAVLIYLKFRPSDELIGHDWYSLDKYFKNEATIHTDEGYTSASADNNDSEEKVEVVLLNYSFTVFLVFLFGVVDPGGRFNN